jgi:L-iditol 2-dehydrogenase
MSSPAISPSVTAPGRTPRAAVLHAPGRIEVVDRPEPEAAADELVVEVLTATLCGTDVRIFHGTKPVALPRVLGHEVAARVVAMGDDVAEVAGSPRPGDMVGIAPSIACGRCRDCRAARGHLCAHKQALGHQIDGGLASHLRLPARAVTAGNVVRSTGTTYPAEVALAEPLSCVVHGQRRTPVELGDVVLLLGAGPIGLLHLQVALRSGARTVVVSEPNAQRRALAAQLGATHVVDPAADAPTAVVDDLTQGRGADCAFICMGRPELIDDALLAVRMQGRVNLFAGFAGDGAAEIRANLIHYKELQVGGSSDSAPLDYALALELIETGQVDVAPLLTHEFALGDVTEALRAAESGAAMKVAVVP